MVQLISILIWSEELIFGKSDGNTLLDFNLDSLLSAKTVLISYIIVFVLGNEPFYIYYYLLILDLVSLYLKWNSLAMELLQLMSILIWFVIFRSGFFDYKQRLYCNLMYILSGRMVLALMYSMFWIEGEG